MTQHGHAGIVDDLESLATSWQRHLVARNLSPYTIDGYVRTARFFVEYLEDNDLPVSAPDITREHVEAFITEVLQTRASATAATRYLFRADERWSLISSLQRPPQRVNSSTQPSITERHRRDNRSRKPAICLQSLTDGIGWYRW